MPKTVFTAEELASYFDASFKSDIQEKAKEFERDLRVHADGEFPEKIISKTRPNESVEVFEYRKSIWKSKTKPAFGKVFNSLQKIRRSSDWSVQYPAQQSSKIPEGETLEDYANEFYPRFESVEKYMFNVWLREYLIDANAVCAVFPGENPQDETDFKTPVAEIFNSELVIFFRADDFCILKNPLGTTFVENGSTLQGESFYILTTQSYLKYDQVNSKREFSLVADASHNFGYMPAWKLGGVLVKTFDGELLYESKVAGMLPELDEAVREYSDLQAAVIMNIFPERWEMATAECPECHGTGKITNATSGTGYDQCSKCSGVGYQPVSPFAKTLVKPAEVGQQIAIPPVGYIDKPVEIVELQDRRVNKHIFDALAAINMEFLAETPLSESGISKEVDRDETNNFVNSVAEDLVNSMELILYYIARLRYGVQHGEEEVDEMQPKISIPKHFDIFSIKYDEEELASAKTNKLNPVLINAMEVSYATKKFSSEPNVQKKLIAVLTLDPLANVSEDDKAMRLSNNGISQEDYILSCNINSFVERAIAENQDFLELDPVKQKEILMKYVAEVKHKTTMEGQLKAEMSAAALGNEPEEEEEAVEAE
jgi:hypothetical protein